MLAKCSQLEKHACGPSLKRNMFRSDLFSSCLKRDLTPDLAAKFG